MTNKITKVYKNWVAYDIYASGWAAGTGDVTWPSSSTDADIALFDWATWKIIKDSWKKLSNYQTALSTQTAYSSKGTATKVPTITTNTLWQVTGITETNISFPVTSVNGSTWAVTVQPTLVSWTNIKTVNWESVLGSWNISISAPSYTAGNWIDITNDEIWLNGSYSAVESDMKWPAPSWFHIPLNTDRQAVYDVWTALWGWSSDWTNFWIALKLPFNGYRYFSNAGVGNQGTRGYYWSSSRYDASNAYSLSLSSTSLNPQNNNSRAFGFAVRCFKNTPTVPTSSWTKLYWTSIESWWIFWSSADWLISLSSDWQTWITIADKNLWATIVWNSWATLSEANCWKYYQRWNNYGFPRTWSVTTSSTQVDASNYWPWNYYLSSTYITYNGRWDTTDNWNLWWWTSQWTYAWLSWNLILWDKFYKIVTSTTAPASWTASNIITISTGSTKWLYVWTTKIA